MNLCVWTECDRTQSLIQSNKPNATFSLEMDFVLNYGLNGIALDVLQEVEDQYHLPRRRFHLRDDAFDLSDRQFVRLYRLNKPTTARLIDTFEHYIDPQKRSSAVDTTVKVLTALRFFAAGSYQLDIGQSIHTADSQSSVSRSIHNVIAVLNQPEVLDTWVKFSRNMQELIAVRNEFWVKHRVPGVIGCIDCTHVAIIAPGMQDAGNPEHIYVNRKGYHSINVQLICDAKLKILNVNARFSGSTHDSYIWNNSNILPVLQELYNRHETLFLLGDSGYALRPWILTPIPGAVLDTPEYRYTQRQMSTRSIIERCNALLKMRFRCLLKHRVLHYSPRTAAQIINACTVLHNMCVEANVPGPPLEDGDEYSDFGLGVNYNENEAIDNIRNVRANVPNRRPTSSKQVDSEIFHISNQSHKFICICVYLLFHFLFLYLFIHIHLLYINCTS